jgi:ClpP class serine protease
MQITIFDILWILFLFATLSPVLQRKWLEMRRDNIIDTLQKKRKSRVIALIHRQETFSFLGIPFSRFIDIEDSESVLRAIRLTPKNVPIDFIIHTPGGLVLAAEQIARALVRHTAPVTVFIPHYAMSGGTLIALAGDRIVMDENAVLGPLDPQLGEYPAASLLNIIKKKPTKNLDDKTLILANIAEKALKQVKETVISILMENGVLKEKAKLIAHALTSGQWTHDYPIEYEEAKQLGLPVEVGLPREIYDLMDEYPQAAVRRPSVHYIPFPYQKEPEDSKKVEKRR